MLYTALCCTQLYKRELEQLEGLKQASRCIYGARGVHRVGGEVISGCLGAGAGVHLAARGLCRDALFKCFVAPRPPR